MLWSPALAARCRGCPMAGKGSTRRPEDGDKYRQQHDRIFPPKPKAKP